MEPILALLVGVLLSGAVYLMLGRNLVKFLIGLMLLSNAANLTIFAAGRLTWAAPSLVPLDATQPAGQVANALPQALILTAIVISFGLVAFALVLAYRAYQEIGTVDTDAMRLAEPEDDKEPATEPEAPARERDAA